MSDETQKIEETDSESPTAEGLEPYAALNDRYLRLAAEFENFKKRSERDRLSAIRFANEGFLLELLPVLDNLEQALQAAITQQNPENQAISKGVEMVLKQFLNTLERFGITQFSAQGLPFDPNVHEAVLEQEDEKVAPGHVSLEYQKGYKLHDRLVRPARVVVAKAKETHETH